MSARNPTCNFVCRSASSLDMLSRLYCPLWRWRTRKAGVPVSNQYILNSLNRKPLEKFPNRVVQHNRQCFIQLAELAKFFHMAPHGFICLTMIDNAPGQGVKNPLPVHLLYILPINGRMSPTRTSQYGLSSASGESSPTGNSRQSSFALPPNSLS